MPRLRRGLFLAVVVLTAVAVVGGEAAGADTGGDEMDVATRVNGLRASRGLAPLAVKGELFDLSRAWSARMAASGTLAHNPSMAQQAPAGWTRLADNVGTGTDVVQVFDAFLDSGVHLANMLDPAVQSIGVGVARAASGESYVTVTFMAGGSTAMVRKVVRVCSRNGRGRTVCVRRVRMVPA